MISGQSPETGKSQASASRLECPSGFDDGQQRLMISTFHCLILTVGLQGPFCSPVRLRVAEIRREGATDPLPRGPNGLIRTSDIFFMHVHIAPQSHCRWAFLAWLAWDWLSSMPLQMSTAFCSTSTGRPGRRNTTTRTNPRPPCETCCRFEGLVTRDTAEEKRRRLGS